MKSAACFTRFALIVLALLGLAQAEPAAAAVGWTSPNHYRILFTVDHMSQTRRNSPASVDIDFVQYLANKGVTGAFDDNTIEVVAYTGAGQPVVFDNAGWRSGYEQYLLPWRIQKYYGVNRVTLSFVLPSNTYTQYAVYFDTVESGHGRPDRYHGLVGDGDVFTDGYQEREINASGTDAFCDFDGDGDLDLFKAGVEPYVYVYENVNGHSPDGNLYVERGKLTNNGQAMHFPTDGSNRSCMSLAFADWDKDGDQDMFVHVYAPIPWRGPSEPPGRAPPNWAAGNSVSQVIIYENTTAPGGLITFVDRGPMRTASGWDMGCTVTFVDWDNDGKLDVLAGPDGAVVLHRNSNPNNSLQSLNVSDGELIYANGDTTSGVPISLPAPRIDCGDLDGDGDLDMLAGETDGRVYWFENVAGPGNPPIFLIGRIIAFYEFMDLVTGVKIHDFDGDGKLDFVAGRIWERTQWGEQPRFYGCLYKNVTLAGGPVKFEAKPAGEGSPYTQQFQQCDAVRQNGVRSVDWNNDGKTDLIASDTDGFVWFFENTTDQLFPIFEPGVKIQANGKAIRVYGEEDANRAAGYARVDVCYWDDEGLPGKKKDLLVADGRGWLTLFINIGTDSTPLFGPGVRVSAYNSTNVSERVMHLIDGTGRATVLVCDWDKDGKKDLIFGMVGDWQFSEYADWPRMECSPVATGGYLSNDSGFLFYKNSGTNNAPVLDYPSWIRTSDGQHIWYSSRPNLGSFVDWDYDGKKDFITAEFENSARFYRNTGPNTPGALPVFSTSWPNNGDMGEGQAIVEPDTVQMMSGADALDWNRDWTGDPAVNQDIDIVTGQGHGASGLRFYDRDYINDYVNLTTFESNTFPLVSLGGSAELGCSPADAKGFADGTVLTLPGATVSAVFSGCFYVESVDRVSAIRVNWTGAMPTIGQVVDVTGTITTNAQGERCIAATSVLGV